MRELNLTKEEGVLTARITCELDHHTARTVRAAIDGVLTGGEVKLLVLDFSGVPFMDSSGLGLIIGRTDIASSVGASVKVVGLLPSLRRLVSLSGLGKLENLTVAD